MRGHLPRDPPDSCRLYSLGRRHNRSAMSNSAAALARSLSARFNDLVAFEATQTIQAGPIEATAHVRFRKPDRAIVEYSTYRNPIAEADEMLGGDVEFSSDDLTAMTLTYDGVHTWHASARSDARLKRVGRTLYEPLPGYDALGELGFLADLTRDFLIRDAGGTVELGRPAHALGLKPKRARQSHLLKAVSYPFDRAVVDVDDESLFPVRVRFQPPSRSPLGSVLGRDGWIAVRYTDVRLGVPDVDAFVPALAKDVPLFEETFPAFSNLAAELPVPLRLDALLTRGFEPLDPCSLVVDGPRQRGYATVLLARRGLDEATGDAFLTVRIGNYVSRHMARRRAIISERGEELPLGEHTGRFLDRSVLWDGNRPAPPPAPFPLELSWEQDGIFTILTAEGLTKTELALLAAELASR